MSSSVDLIPWEGTAEDLFWAGVYAMHVRWGELDPIECDLCAQERPCACSGGPCECSCGRCQYPFPLPDDGP